MPSLAPMEKSVLIHVFEPIPPGLTVNSDIEQYNPVNLIPGSALVERFGTNNAWNNPFDKRPFVVKKERSWLSKIASIFTTSSRDEGYRDWMSKRSESLIFTGNTITKIESVHYITSELPAIKPGISNPTEITEGIYCSATDEKTGTFGVRYPSKNQDCDEVMKNNLKLGICAGYKDKPFRLRKLRCSFSHHGEQEVGCVELWKSDVMTCGAK